MAKSEEKNKALKLRQKGESIKDIAKRLGIAKSTVSLWCRDIELTSMQIQRLHDKMVKSGYKGRMIGARSQYNRRIEKIKRWNEQGIRDIGKLSKRDLLLIGTSLYWGEGTKKKRGISFANADPKMIKLIIEFFRKIWGIGRGELSAFIAINKIHKKRLKEVEDYWVRITKIPRKQFTKTILIKAKNKKNYENFPVHYGTLTVKIRKSSEFYYQIMGLIEGLAIAKIVDE